MKYDYEEPFKEALGKITDNNLKKKLVAIRKLVVDRLSLENEFKKENNILDAKYEAIYQPFYEKRKNIVEGTTMPNIEEIKSKLTELNVDNTQVLPQSESGVPAFWVKCLENSKSVIDLNDKDKEVLKHLTDVQCSSKENGDFTLLFFFEKNEFFDHEQLKREFFLNEDFEIKEMTSTDIAWKSDEVNPTIEIKKKKMKNKKTKEIKTITKKESVMSFFTSFRNMVRKPEDDKKKEDEDDEDDDDELKDRTIEEEYDIALQFKEEIIPFAIEYYLGVADNDDFDDEEEEEEDDDDEESAGEETKPAVNSRKGHRHHK